MSDQPAKVADDPTACAKPTTQGVAGGTLAVVATPIGNLGDISRRALQALQQADWIACEDTRTLRKLLHHLDIRSAAQFVSCHAFNERQKIQRLLDYLQAGSRVVLVSDAGTPTIADPGFRLVEACHAAALPVVSLPGPNAAVAALSLSGQPTDSFLFLGFLARKGKQRAQQIDAITLSTRPVVFYEAPTRVADTLGDLAQHFGEPMAARRQVLIAREMTKLHEEASLKPLATWLASPPTAKGEFVLVVEGEAGVERNEAIRRRYRFYQEAGALDDRTAVKLLAAEFDVAEKRVQYLIT